MSPYHAEHARKAWLLFEFVLPVFTLTWLWPMMAYLGDLPFAFEHVFAGADVVPVAALLMLNVWREIELHARAGYRLTRALEHFQFAAILLPVAILILYGFVKYHLMCNPLPQGAVATLDDRFFAIGFVSLVLLLFAGGFGWSAREHLAAAGMAEAESEP